MKFKMKEDELINGRIAMVAMLIFVLSEFTTGKPIIDILYIFSRRPRTRGSAATMCAFKLKTRITTTKLFSC